MTVVMAVSVRKTSPSVDLTLIQHLESVGFSVLSFKQLNCTKAEWWVMESSSHTQRHANIANGSYSKTCTILTIGHLWIHLKGNQQGSESERQVPSSSFAGRLCHFCWACYVRCMHFNLKHHDENKMWHNYKTRLYSNKISQKQKTLTLH